MSCNWKGQSMLKLCIEQYSAVIHFNDNNYNNDNNENCVLA